MSLEDYKKIRRTRIEKEMTLLVRFLKEIKVYRDFNAWFSANKIHLKGNSPQTILSMFAAFNRLNSNIVGLYREFIEISFYEEAIKAFDGKEHKIFKIKNGEDYLFYRLTSVIKTKEEIFGRTVLSLTVSYNMYNKDGVHSATKGVYRVKEDHADSLFTWYEILNSEEISEDDLKRLSDVILGQQIQRLREESEKNIKQFFSNDKIEKINYFETNYSSFEKYIPRSTFIHQPNLSSQAFENLISCRINTNQNRIYTPPTFEYNFTRNLA